MKKIDGELYRKAYESLRQWSEAKMVYRAQLESRLSPQEAWERYVALIEFGWEMCPQPGEWQRQQKLAALARYYERVQRLEAWREGRARSS